MRVIAWHRQACPYLELKTLPRFFPLSLSLAMPPPFNQQGKQLMFIKKYTHQKQRQHLEPTHLANKMSELTIPHMKYLIYS